ncbi:hypothetical protein SLOPH_2454 [Spraguea lophii 42_110]|uniref:AB hydrolase-1 domain-containing protein n=1 Tax=Spraguea lophii (strain 42_110) TaxID=1358809 RepID=S7WAD7_SPRLO|nr:hypothetical protein SLOPH_2454 [Spraguea lophii 42_110]
MNNRKIISCKKKIFKYLYTTIIIILHIFFIMFTIHRSLEYIPRKFTITKFKKYTLNTLDNKNLPIYYVDKNSQIDLIIFPGNWINKYYTEEYLTTFSELNVNVFIMQYRGFSDRDGKPSELNIKIDTEAVYQFLKKRNNKVVIYSFSMGGCPALYLLSLFKIPPLLVLDNVLYDVYTGLTPFMRLFTFLLVDKWQNGKILKNTEVDILFFKSEEDTNVNSEHLKKYKQISKKAIEVVYISDAGHFDAYRKPIFLEKIKNFIESGYGIDV